MTIKGLLMAALMISLFSLGFTTAYLFTLLESQESPFSFSDKDMPLAPNNYIDENDIKLYDDRIVIFVDNPSLSKYAPTGSMLPTLNEYSNGIKITPESEDEIQIGDIITYRSGTDLIVHRVIEKGVDSEGIYFITKGDNNVLSDDKIRFSDIDSMTIALLY